MKKRKPVILISMAHSVNRVTATLLLLLCMLTAHAGPVLRDLNIYVELMDNGDARITEVRQMSIDDVGTECYIVMGFMNGSRVRDLQVSDETGLEYENIGDWDVDASRSRKAGKCGIVTKSDGYELCWGLGNEGERTYTVSYTVTKLVRAYDDADGFNFMFVAQDIKPAAQHAEITFTREEGGEIPQELVKMWAFRYDGDIQWQDGAVVAETARAMEGSEAMIVMLRFEKDFLHPEQAESGSFDQLKDRAFEGSSYSSDDMDAETIFWVLIIAAVIFLSPFVIVGYFGYVWWNRRKANENLLWFRGLPYKGSLKQSYDVLDSYSWFSYSNKNLISALVLKLISIGALRIEEHLVQPSGFRKMTGAKPQMKQLLAIKELHTDEKTPDRFILKRLYSIFAEAAGDDDLLQPNELRNYIKNHPSSIEIFLTNIKNNRSISQCNKDMKNVREVLGMQLFLKDFTLANERHVTELSLWKDYLVFAELFGIAKQVRKDMMKANPEYMNMDEVYRQLNDTDILPAITYATLAGIGDVQKASSSSGSSGGGGWASFSGGGGFSGGGSGGGVR